MRATRLSVSSTLALSLLLPASAAAQPSPTSKSPTSSASQELLERSERARRPAAKRPSVPAGPMAGQTVGPRAGVAALSEADCRLNGGIVIKPGDDRCGFTGAMYCRKPDGEAACLTER